MDTGIPTVAALAYDPASFPESSEIVFAAGTTTDPAKSLIRALTEVAQLAGDFHRRTSYRPTLPKYESLEEAAYLMAPGPLVPLDSLPNLAHENLKVEIGNCLKALARLHLEVLAVDVTHPRIGIPAVYVLIPGTHFLERTRNTNVVFHLAKTAALYAEPMDGLVALQQLNQTFPGALRSQLLSGPGPGQPGEPRRGPGPFPKDPGPQSPGSRSSQHPRAPGQLP